MGEVKLEEAPLNVRAFYDKGVAAMERANLDYAMDMFEEALAIDPRILQIRRLLRAAAVRKRKDAPPGRLTGLKGISGLLKIALKKKSDPLKALQEAEKLMRMDPLNRFFAKALCDAAVTADMPEVAIQTLEILKDHRMNDFAVLESLAGLYRDTKQYRREYECRSRIIRLKPNDSAALKELKDAAARNTMDKAGWDGAGSFRDVMKDGAESAVLEETARLVKDQAGLEILKARLIEKVAAEPANISHRRELADLYLRGGQFDEAIVALEECLRLTGGADPQLDRALAAARSSRLDLRIVQAEAQGNSGEVTRLREELDRFRLDDASERVRRYPNDLQLKFDYGVQLFGHHRFTEAIQQFQSAQRNPQRRIRSLYYLGLCFKQKGQFDIAFSQLEQARSELTAMDDTKKDVLYELGALCEAMEDTPRAIRFYKEIYAVDIGYRDVAAKVEQIRKP